MMKLTSHSSVKHPKEQLKEAYIFSMAEAEDVLPSKRNHGLKPSEDPALMMRRCFMLCVSDVHA